MEVRQEIGPPLYLNLTTALNSFPDFVGEWRSATPALGVVHALHALLAGDVPVEALPQLHAVFGDLEADPALAVLLNLPLHGGPHPLLSLPHHSVHILLSDHDFFTHLATICEKLGKPS